MRVDKFDKSEENVNFEKKQIKGKQIEKKQTKREKIENQNQISSKIETGYHHVQHDFPPVYNEYSEILILGSFPSVKSREAQFYYHHPQNRFWKVLSQIFKENIPETITEKKTILFKNKIALWDVIESCDIIGSSDSSIKNVTIADIGKILKVAPIREIYVNGGKASSLYIKYCEPLTKRSAIKLPSTSPANASFSLERLIDAWHVIKKE